MKLRSLHIEDYKVFKDFGIDFLDKEDNPLPIVVLAGVNGSGKTTLFEFLNEFNCSVRGNNYVELDDFKSIYKVNSSIVKEKKKFDLTYQKIEDKKFPKGSKGIHISFYNPPTQFHGVISLENIKYIKAGINNTQDIADEFVKSFYFFLKEKDYRPSEVKEHFNNYMKNIFQNINLTFKYHSLTKEDKVIFTDEHNKQFFIDAFSTGEKTLLSKVLYLFFQDYKDKIILIDEPELSLHPSWQNKVLKIYENFAEANNCQVIIATHSPHIIGSAKNEYLRILRKNDDGNIEVIDDVLAYGRDIEWVLEEVMGTDYVRNKKILDKIEECQNFIDEEKYDKAEEAIDRLEELIGDNDSEILTLRNNLAFERIDFEEDN